MIAQTGEPSHSTRTAFTLSPLRYQRLLRGWSLADVASAIYQRCAHSGEAGVGITADTVGRWERGLTLPRPLYRKHLCALYGMTTEQLGLLHVGEGQHA